jgi:hypothetical protein
MMWGCERIGSGDSGICPTLDARDLLQGPVRCTQRKFRAIHTECVHTSASRNAPGVIFSGVPFVFS